MDRLRQRLGSIADAHGLAAVGVTDAAPFVEARETLVRRVADGLNGSLRFTFAEPASSTDIRSSFPWAERLIAASRAYLPTAGRPAAQDGVGVVARFAVDDPYAPLIEALEEMAGTLRHHGFSAEILVDDNRLDPIIHGFLVVEGLGSAKTPS